MSIFDYDELFFSTRAKYDRESLSFFNQIYSVLILAKKLNYELSSLSKAAKFVLMLLLACFHEKS